MKQQWTVKYQFVAARDEAEARQFAEFKARQDVPTANTEIIGVTRTPTGRFTVEVRRTRQ